MVCPKQFTLQEIWAPALNMNHQIDILSSAGD